VLSLNNFLSIFRTKLVFDTDGSELFLLEWAHKLSFLFDGLESTVTELGGGINGFKIDFLQIFSFVVGQQRLPQQDWSLSDAHARSLDHDEIVLNFTVVREASYWINRFLGQISLGGTVVKVGLAVLGFITSAQSVDFFVDLNSVVVTFLTASGNGVGDSGWMPRTNTSDLSETSMRFSGKFFSTPSAGYTLSSVTLSDTNAIGVVVVGEDFVDWDLLFEETLGEVDLGSGVATVDLELDDVSFLLLEWDELHLGVGDESDDLAVLFDLVQTGLLARFSFGPFLLVLSESQFLGFSPVLVESPFSFIRNVLGPDGLERSKASWGLDVTNDTNSDHWWAIDDGDWLDDFFLVKLVALSSDFSDDVGHTGFITDETGQMRSFGFVILWVGLESAEMSSGSLSWEESFGTVSWGLKFSVRHFFYL
jgi:hypothetical protein